MSTAELDEVGVDAELGTDDARVMLERQTEVLELVAGAAPLPDVLTAILTSLEHLMPGARCSVLLLDRDSRTLHHGAAPSLPGDYVAAIDGMAIGELAGSCGTAAAANTPIVATDVRVDPRWVDFRHLAADAGLRSCWSTPIVGRDGLPVGTFAVYHPRPHRPTGRERLLVDRFTRLATVAIDHAALVGALVESEERFRRSFDDNSLGMAILGPDRTIASSNTALTTLAGRRGDLAGVPLGDLVTPCRRSLHDRLDDLDRDGAAPTVFEARLRRTSAADGALDVEVEVTVSLLRARDDGPVQYVVNVFDLTERRAAERDRRARAEAETARRTAEELAHARSELLAAVGHEARTPIQAIVGFAELLATLDLDKERRREALHHIGAAAGHVMDLLTDVLDLSRLEVGALPMVLEQVSVDEVVGEVLGLLSTKAEHRRVVLSHVPGTPAPGPVTADRRRLRQVLLNLVGNAIQHGRPGGSVQVRCRPDATRSELVVTVDDDGPGIPPELLPRLFTPFGWTRSEPDPDHTGDPHHEESIGLGLGLAHGLLSAMGGRLDVGRSDARGTSMELRLPRGLPRPTDPDADPAPAPTREEPPR